MANYQYIISSLQNYSFDSDTKDFDAVALSNDLQELLSKEDWSTLKELWWFFDLRNILSLLSGRLAIYSPLSNLDQTQTERIADYYKGNITENDIENDPLAQFPDYVKHILDAYIDSVYAADQEIDTSITIDKQVWNSYYQQTIASKNSFISEWNQFDLNIRNISAAYTARLKGIDVESVVIGSNEITRLIIRNSNVQDFGLKNEFAQIDEFLAILADNDMLNKERRLDKLRWNKIEDIITFDYFNIEYILGYMVQISMLERWTALTSEHGAKVLDKMVSTLVSKDNLKTEE